MRLSPDKFAGDGHYPAMLQGPQRSALHPSSLRRTRLTDSGNRGNGRKTGLALRDKLLPTSRYETTTPATHWFLLATVQKAPGKLINPYDNITNPLCNVTNPQRNVTNPRCNAVNPQRNIVNPYCNIVNQDDKPVQLQERVLCRPGNILKACRSVFKNARSSSHTSGTSCNTSVKTILKKEIHTKINIINI